MPMSRLVAGGPAGIGPALAQGRHFAALAHHNFSSGCGAGRFDWSFPLYGPLHGCARGCSGYGYNLLDYNHRQTTVGIGLLLTDRP